MKPQATTKQIENTTFVLSFILLTFRNLAYIQGIQLESCLEKLWVWWIKTAIILHWHYCLKNVQK